MSCSRKLNNMINKINERAPRLTLNGHISGFDALLKTIMILVFTIVTSQLVVEINNITNNPNPPIMDLMFERRDNTIIIGFFKSL